MDICRKLYISVLILPVLAMFSCTGNSSGPLTSPNKEIKVSFWMEGGNQPYYEISYRDSVVLDRSHLGLVKNKIDFSQDMSLESVSDADTIDVSYKMLHGKQKAVTYHAAEKRFTLRHKSGEVLDVIFRVSNDGVAFRYHFPGESEEQHHISEEKTRFNLPEGSRAWLEPLANVNTGFAETNPSYEEHYYEDIEVGTPAPDSAGWAYPALFKAGSHWLLISESGMDGNYPATRLQQQAPDGNYQVGFPQLGEQFPGEALYPQSMLPWSSPWRTIAIGDLKAITESTLGTDLAGESQVTNASWVKPGRASWSWAKLKDASITYDVQKRFVNYAAEMGWEYTLVDVNWDTTIGYDRIAELAEYAASQDIGLFLWYNSSGSWNSTPYHPKSELLTHEDRVEEFSRLQEIGIKGIKVDFFAGDGQSMMQYYLDIFKDAADHHLMVNTHGTTLPRGWHRTWPNLMTMESVKGFEFITFEQGNADRAAKHNTMLPFTRNVYSPMDYTPMSLTELTNVDRKTTAAHELALPVLFTSGIQHYAETARGMGQVPSSVRQFIKKIPVTWDEMEFVDGFPGEDVVIARRDGSRWFVAGINGEENPKKITLDLSFIPKESEGFVLTDGEATNTFSKSEISVLDSVSVSLREDGGFVMFFNNSN